MREKQVPLQIKKITKRNPKDDVISQSKSLWLKYVPTPGFVQQKYILKKMNKYWLLLLTLSFVVQMRFTIVFCKNAK